VTLLYRSDVVDSPKFGRGTFWTMHRNRAEYIAQVEAATPILPESQIIYQADVTIGDAVREYPVDDRLRSVAGKPMGEALPLLRDALLTRAEQAGPVEWMQFTAQDRPWAMLYVGDEPVPAHPVPPEDSE